MAEPIRSYTPRRDFREELRRKVESAPMDHADALLAAYELLQEAQDHGVLDALRGGIGAGETTIGKISEYANTPEGVRTMRNVLALARLLGEVDPTLIDAVRKAISRGFEGDSAPISPWQAMQKLTGKDSRRTLGIIAGVVAAFGETWSAVGSPKIDASDRHSLRSSIAGPVIAVGIVAVLASFWIGRHS
jgi:uncharacterized protein YjgD (DUF1641 family)